MSHSGMGRRHMVNGDEYDAYTAWRKLVCWASRPGAIKKVKRRTHRRERREAKQFIDEQIDDET